MVSVRVRVGPRAVAQAAAGAAPGGGTALRTFVACDFTYNLRATHSQS